MEQTRKKKNGGSKRRDPAGVVYSAGGYPIGAAAFGPAWRPPARKKKSKSAAASVGASPSVNALNKQMRALTTKVDRNSDALGLGPRDRAVLNQYLRCVADPFAGPLVGYPSRDGNVIGQGSGTKYTTIQKSVVVRRAFEFSVTTSATAGYWTYVYVPGLIPAGVGGYMQATQQAATTGTLTLKGAFNQMPIATGQQVLARIVSQGVELVNTTAAQNRGGLVHFWPSVNAEGMPANAGLQQSQASSGVIGELESDLLWAPKRYDGANSRTLMIGVGSPVWTSTASTGATGGGLDQLPAEVTTAAAFAGHTLWVNGDAAGGPFGGVLLRFQSGGAANTYLVRYSSVVEYFCSAHEHFAKPIASADKHEGVYNSIVSTLTTPGTSSAWEKVEHVMNGLSRGIAAATGLALNARYAKDVLTGAARATSYAMPLIEAAV